VSDRLRPLWDFEDLEATENRLRMQLGREATEAGRAEVLTQIARVHGLRRDFTAAERLLEQAEGLAGASAIARIRIRLERGRLLRSAGDSAGSLPLFESTFDLASRAGEQFLAADAAHMAGLAAPDREGRLSWTRRGIEIAEAASERQVAYWLGPLLNNLGCEYADAGEHEAALDAFERALEARLRFPEMPEEIQHARDSVAEELHALGRGPER
jgi:tetratricopeptide (TPR) repeat protein